MQHPDDKRLQLFVAAQLDAEQEKAIEEHLDECPQCLNRVSELERSPEDPLLQKMKAAAGNADVETEAVDMRELVRKLGESATPLTPGEILDETWQLEEKLGRGGMGETWKTRDKVAERHVVLKFVPREMQNMPEVMASVRSSFQKIHALQHQHICPVYSLVDDPANGLYIIMKYINGLTLSEYRRRLAEKKLRMSFSDIVQILWAVAKGLDYAHERKVIHRDIKPGNIMIGRKDGVQIIDFGLAEEIRTLLTQASDSVAMSSSGTRPYMAPEQWQGRVQDARTDQYALAVTAYELFAGHVPFSGSDMELLKSNVLNDPPEAIAGLPEHVNEALLKALSKKREERFENCKTFIRALVTKPETPDFTEIEDEKFSEGDMSLPDLPTDRTSDENAPPIWLPTGFSSMSQSSAMTDKSDVSPKQPLPTWVWPTISGLLTLVVVFSFGMIAFLGYMLWDRQPERQDVAVAKHEDANQSSGEPGLKPVDAAEEGDQEGSGSEDATEDAVDDVAENKVEDKVEDEAVDDETSVAPVLRKEMQPVLLTLEPAVATEARRHYEETVMQARQPYSDELDKELTSAKQKGDLNLVLAYEAELQHLAVEDAADLTPFMPEKRTLATLKNQYKRQAETALTDYRKTLETLVKTLVQEDRVAEAKLVQDTLDHLADRELKVTKPKLYPKTAVPVIRFLVEIAPDGKGRAVVAKKMSTDPYNATFQGTPFPLSAFPNAQAFRGENGLGRVFFDFRNADPVEKWENSGWHYGMKSSWIDQERNTYRLSSREDKWPYFQIYHFERLPCRVQFEFILDREHNMPNLKIHTHEEDDRHGVLDCWTGINGDRIHLNGYYSLPGQEERHDLGYLEGDVDETLQLSFQLPEEMVSGVETGMFFIMKHMDKVKPGGETNVDITFVDMIGHLKHSPGFSVIPKEDALVIDKLAPKGAAARAGLQEGDELTRFNGIKRTAEQIQKILDHADFGDPITVTVIQDNEEKTFRFHVE